MWFDTHAHLSDPQFDHDREAAIERALAKGVKTILEIADGPDEWDKARQLAENHPGRLWWAAGFHPYFSDLASNASWERLRSHAGHPQFLAIGEVGLDYAKCRVPHETQKKTLIDAVEFARDTKKPLIIHCRDAFHDLLPLLKSFAGRLSASPGVLHCFTGTTEDAHALLDLGFYLGVDGPVTYPSSKILRETLTQIPLEKLLLETDSPYLPPQTHRGQRNEPGHLPSIGEAVAKLRGVATEKLAEVALRNSRVLFGLKASPRLRWPLPSKTR